MNIQLNAQAIAINLTDVAFALAELTGEEQAAFFNDLNKLLLEACESEHNKELQMCDIAKNLDKETKSFFDTMVFFIQELEKQD